MAERKAIGSRVRELREERSWSLTDLEERSGVDRTQIWKIETGDTKRPRMSTIVRLAHALRVTPKDLGAESKAPTVDLLLRWLEELPEADHRMVREHFFGGRDDEPAQRPEPDKYMPFEVPPEKFIVGDWDYPQTFRGGRTELLGGAAAGGFDDIDVTGETAEVLNPTLRDVQSGRYGVVRVKGHSMEPRLHDGDLVLLDTFEKTPRPQRIMAVYARGQGSAFGYVHRVGELTILTKANPGYAPLILPDDVIIRGTVKKRLSEDLE